MDESTRSWFNKLENKFDNFSTTMIEKVTELTTTLNIYLPRQDDHEKRINRLEDDVAEIKSDNRAKHRNQTLLIGIGAIIAVIAGVLIDKYLLK